jgi:hypothetical protein
MRYFDVFNGDADGICALHQLRLADPLDSELVTGLKRDIALLDRVPAGDGDVVTVLDISLDRNRAGLIGLLDRGAVVRYFDHHYAGPVPKHPNLEVMIDPSGVACTSTLVDRHLWGRFRPWAVVGAFGDGIVDVALGLARPLGLETHVLDALRDLGETLNYNAYGEADSDVLLPPADVYRAVSRHDDPYEMLREEPVIAQMSYERRADLERALDTGPLVRLSAFDAFLLPDEAWSRRVSGTFANRLALDDPTRTHVVLTPAGSGYVVSVRSPEGSSPSAVEFCRRYPGGGGRMNAAGINRLSEENLQPFLDAAGRESWILH